MNFDNIQDFLDKLEETKDDLIKNAVSDLLTVSLDAIGLIRLRLGTTGLNADGNNFSPYSPRWSRNRQERGRDITKKNFIDTGQLLRSLTVKPQADGSVIIEPRTQDDINKLAGASLQNDFPIRLSAKEIEALQQSYITRKLNRLSDLFA
jgi:hypothetical protein